MIASAPQDPAGRTIVHQCEIEAPGPFCLIVFGASGDLARKKIFPALYRLHKQGLLPEDFFLLGAARTSLDNQYFRDSCREAVREEFPADFDEAMWDEMTQRMYYATTDYHRTSSYIALREQLASLEQRHRTQGNRVFYLALPPDVYEPVITNLGDAGLSEEHTGFTHIVIEKPFGRDLESARRLNTTLKTSFQEQQIYRIDHYLAKETVQNIIMFRFANSIFEPIWNRNFIDHIQITVSETIGVDHRAGYYEKAGVVRDMFQNHLFQLLALTAMEAPTAFEAERVRDEKIKVFRSLRPLPLDRIEEHVVLGQYGPGSVKGEAVRGYREEQNVPSGSATPTFAAFKLFIDNWKWNDVPFYLRSGKRLSKKTAEISVHFKAVPHLMFARTLDECIEPNVLTLRIQPEEGIGLVFQAKSPGSRVCLSPVVMDFSYRKPILLSDYERALLDCMHGDQMLFVREDAVEETWARLTPVIERLESSPDAWNFPNYAAGSEGPVQAADLIGRDGRSWRPL